MAKADFGLDAVKVICTENNFSLDIDSLYIKQAYAGDGVTMKRYKARSRGRAAPRLRRHSHITIIVDQREVQ